jgi:biopolymer transport protein ExbD
MNRILVVCLTVLALAACLGLGLAAQPQPRRGISVDMPATSNATSMPCADQKNARIVTVTHDGKVYLGARPIDPAQLNSELTENSAANAPDETLYIKADARASYGTVIKVLDAATRAGFETTVLLTNQNDSPQAGTLSPPKGFAIVTGECREAHCPRLSL